MMMKYHQQRVYRLVLLDIDVSGYSVRKLQIMPTINIAGHQCYNDHKLRQWQIQTNTRQNVTQQCSTSVLYEYDSDFEIATLRSYVRYPLQRVIYLL